MSGSDTIVINGRNLTDLADGNCVELTFPNDIGNLKVGKNGNTIYGFNEMGKQADVILRLVRGSSDDRYMNGLLVQQNQNFAAFVLMSGQFTKKIGDGQGNVSSDAFVIGGGIFNKQTEGKDNVEGDTEQSVAIYHLKFSAAPRAIS